MIEKTDDSSPSAPTSLPDKMAPFRALFGMPVAVQFAAQTPYVQVSPLVDRNGMPQTALVTNPNRVIGLPAFADQQPATAVAVGVLRASEDGTWLVIEEKLGIHASKDQQEQRGIIVRSHADLLVGQALMDVYVRPEMVTHISFVKSVELVEPRRSRETS